MDAHPFQNKMTAEKLRHKFNTEKPVIGMIHLMALPGTAAYGGSETEIMAKALEEALIYKKAGVDMVMLENMHDVPYLKGAVGPEITSMMSVLGYEIKKTIGLPTGMQILAGANQEALAAAKAANLDFIRAEGFVFAHVGDEGLIESNAGELLRYRAAINASDILVFTDIQKKHSAHSITADLDILEIAEGAEFFRSDGVVITGRFTGGEANFEELSRVKDKINIPVLVGSGVTEENVEAYLAASDAVIVGSWFKEEGKWKNNVSYERVARFMEKVSNFRN